MGSSKRKLKRNKKATQKDGCLHVYHVELYRGEWQRIPHPHVRAGCRRKDDSSLPVETGGNPAYDSHGWFQCGVRGIQKSEIYRMGRRRPKQASSSVASLLHWHGCTHLCR